MAGPNATVTRTNVLAGPGQLWRGLFGTAVEPNDTDVGLTPNTAPGAGWTDAGLTEGGLTITVNQTHFSMRGDQVPDSLGERLTQREVMVATNLAEGTLENLAVAFNRDPAIAVEVDGSPPVDWRRLELVPGQAAMRPTEFKIIVDGWAPGDIQVMRRFIARRVVSVESVGSSWQKDGQYFVPVTFKALYVDANTSPVKWTDEPAS